MAENFITHVGAMRIIFFLKNHFKKLKKINLSSNFINENCELFLKQKIKEIILISENQRKIKT